MCEECEKSDNEHSDEEAVPGDSGTVLRENVSVETDEFRADRSIIDENGVRVEEELVVEEFAQSHRVLFSQFGSEARGGSNVKDGERVGQLATCHTDFRIDLNKNSRIWME